MRGGILAGGALAGLAAATGGAVLWSRQHREDRPYGPRWLNELLRPGITRRRLNAVLAPRPGERLLEVGPGYGYYSVGVARSLQPTGTLELLDVRSALLDQTMARIAEAGLANVQSTVGDAVRLPYPDAAFDGAYLVACLGEIADQEAAIRELARVLRPGGRLVVGETVADPHRVPLDTLAEMTRRSGLEADAVIGRRSYVARFVKRVSEE